MPDLAPVPTVLAARARTAAVTLLLALGAVAVLLIARDASSPGSAALLALFLLVPLLLPLPGLWRGQRRTFAWATLCLTPHFVFALTEIVANPALRSITAAMLLLGTSLMIALVAYLRLTRGSGERIADSG
jgi:uncharacterized membrane protein